ncbi:hypothetical protein L7F22_067810 [Adiantum nelumboides]|nr:hypothetical protein [Adiantum nelumboides]
MVEKEKDLKVKSIRSDRGGEFLSENFARWCKSEGIRRQLTTPYTPSQNGVVERKNRTIMEMARAMLAHASLPRSYWAEACNTSVYIQNRSPTHALQDMTPFQAYYRRKPTVSYFRVFGCSAFVHIPKEKRQKLDFKSRKLLFLGYSAESDAYRLYDPDTKTTTVSRDVVFDESFITFAEGPAAQPISILPPPSLPDPPASPVITPSTSHPVPPMQPPDVSPDHALSDSDSDLDVADATPEVDLAPPRRQKRISGWLYSTVASSGVTELPVPPPAGLPRRSARLQKRRQAEQHRKKFNEGLKDKELKRGMLVLRYDNCFDNRKDNKFLSRWKGPFLIRNKYSNGSYQLQDINGRLHKTRVNDWRLKPYFQRFDPQLWFELPPETKEEEENGFSSIQHYEESVAVLEA